MPLSPFLIWNIWKDDLNFKCLAARVSCRGWVDKEPSLIGPWSRQLEQLRWQVRVFKGGLYSVTPCCRHWQLLLWPLARCRQPRLHFIPRCYGFRVPFAGKIPQTCTHATSWIHFIATTCNYFLQPSADIVHQQTTWQLASKKSKTTHAVEGLSAQTATCNVISVQQGRINQWRGKRSEASRSNHSNESPSEVCTLYWIRCFPLLLPHLPRQ